MKKQKGKRIYPIFIPFSGCKFKCSFCNQWASSGVSREKYKAQIDAAFEFLEKSSKEYDEVSIYGGTPLWSGTGWKIMERIQPFIKNGKVKGIRLSTRPDSITENIILKLKELHVTTVELGIQSLSNEVLECVNRGHTIEDVENAISLLHNVSIDVIGQFMIGLPCEGEEVYDIPLWSKNQALSGVRIFPLVVLRNTEVEKWFNEGKYKPLTVDEAVVKLATIVEKLEEYGIPVIQIGLHSSKELAKNVISGPYVGNLGEMVRSLINYRMLKKGKLKLDDIPISQQRMFNRWRRLEEHGHT